jgi:tripartite-type tricarboxylate transporter receptor subunit TctC
MRQKMYFHSFFCTAIGLLIAASGLLISTSASAQAWPAKPIKLIVNFPPGGSPD